MPHSPTPLPRSHPTNQPAMTPNPPWLILERVPRFHDAAVAVDAKPPPGAAALLLPMDRLNSSIPQGEPLVLSADKLGALLVAFRKPGAYPDLCIVSVAKDTPAASITALPPRKPPVHQIAALTSIGMTPAPGTAAGFVVAELQAVSNTHRARMITFTTEDGEWKEKPLHMPKDHSCRAWGRHGVLSNSGKLWWADLAWGLVCCDPCTPTLRFVELPHGSALSFDHHPAIEGRRAVCVSGSRIRYVEFSRIGDGPSRISIWDLQANRTGWAWRKFEEARFADIWASEGYARTRLPAILPALLLLDPTAPSTACFQLDEYIYCMDFGTNKLQWVQALPHNHNAFIAWELTRHIISPPSAPALPLPWRHTGGVLVRGFVCELVSCSHTCTAICIKSTRATFHIMLCHRNYPIGRLMIEEQYNGSGSISYHQSAGVTATIAPVVVSNIRQFLLYVPVPDIHAIFLLFGIKANEMMDKGLDCTPRASGRVIGSLVDGDKQIIFRETKQETTSLMLECHIGKIEPFGVQLQTPAGFHSLTIIRSLDRCTTRVALKVDEHGPELQICTSLPVCTHVPVPYLARIAGIF